MSEQPTSQDPLRKLLQQWEAPEPGPALDYRVLAAYRGHQLNVPLWKKLWHTQLRVPLPAALMLCVALAGCFWWWDRGHSAIAPGVAPIEPAGNPTPRKAHSMLVATPTGASFVTTLDVTGLEPVTHPHVVIRKKEMKR